MLMTLGYAGKNTKKIQMPIKMQVHNSFRNTMWWVYQIALWHAYQGGNNI